MRQSKNRKELERVRASLIAACGERSGFRDSVIVFGTGPAPCRLMVIGEAPGRHETELGRPFVGKAGRFFTAILEEVFGVPREDIYISNVVKIWPTVKTKRLKTRKPTRQEEEFFIPYLREEILAVDPKVIVAVGKTAFSALAPQDAFNPGEWGAQAEGRLVMPIYHPAYILRRQKSLKESTLALKAALTKVKRRLAGL